MADFDEAKRQTQEMFGVIPETAEETPVEERIEENTGELPPADNQADTPEVTPEGNAGGEAPDTEPENAPGAQTQQSEPPFAAQLTQAANIAEAAAQAAAQSNRQLMAMQQEIARLNEENKHLQDTITQQNETQQERIMQNMLPELDFDKLAFEDPDTRRAAMEDYAGKMRDYVKADIMREITPAMDYAREGIREREKAAAIEALKTIPELKGIEGMVPQLDRIIKSNPMFTPDMDVVDAYSTAYAIARGVNAINTPPPEPPKIPGAEEIIKLLNSNPEAKALYEKQRLAEVQKSQQVPIMSASSGAVNAALNIPEKPKTWEDASERARKAFGLG